MTIIFYGFKLPSLNLFEFKNSLQLSTQKTRLVRLIRILTKEFVLDDHLLEVSVYTVHARVVGILSKFLEKLIVAVI